MAYRSRGFLMKMKIICNYGFRGILLRQIIIAHISYDEHETEFSVSGLHEKVCTFEDASIQADSDSKDRGVT